MKFLKLMIFLLLGASTQYSFARTLYAVTNNGQLNGAIWALSPGGTACCSPEAGDVLIIPNGINVNVSSNMSIDVVVYIKVEPTASITFATCNATLNLTGGSGLQVLASSSSPQYGLIDTNAACGGGNSNRVRIGNSTVWQGRCTGNSTPCDNGPYEFGSIGILPVDLLHFSGTNLQNVQVALDWATASESNNAYFSIERSQDAQNFQEIAQIASLGEGQGIRPYRHIDSAPQQGINYYRLKQYDHDGQWTSSKTIAIRIEVEAGDWVIFKDAQAQVKTRFFLSESSPCLLQIYDLSGKELLVLPFQGQSGNNEFALPATLPRQGLYLARLRQGQTIQQKKFLLP